MIVDQLTNLEYYRGLKPRWVKALEFLRDADVLTLPLGRHDLDGDRLFALVQEYPTKPTAECRWEAHRRYCDIQFVAKGVERIGVMNIERSRVEQAYDADRDVAFFVGDGDFITMHPGTFAIFAPQDVHLPCVALEATQSVRKIVVKAEL